MAQLFGNDVHQQIFAFRVLAIEALKGILHRRGELTVCAAKLFEQHISKVRIGLADVHCVHQFFYVVIHTFSGTDEWRLMFLQRDNQPHEITGQLRAAISESTIQRSTQKGYG
jgi:hypothetical protein